jgi:iron complex transport system permease protein
MDLEKIYIYNRKRRLKILLSLLFLLCAVAGLSSLLGPAKIPITQILAKGNLPILQLRLARIVLAVFVGAGLACAGTIFQGILLNPLAEPYILGVSSGASLGVVASLALGLGGTFLGLNILPLFGFLGAILTIILVYSIAEKNGRLPVQTLILCGVIVGTVFSGLVIFLITVTPGAEALHDVIWWLLGSLQVFDLKLLILVCATIFIGIATSMFFRKELNVLALGEEEAVHLGLKVEDIKRILLTTASLITAAAVSASGIIGFVGLIVPHAMRLIVGPEHRVLLPASALAGGVFLVACDIAARNLIFPLEIPIGVITALIGGPIFIILARKNVSGAGVEKRWKQKNIS